MRCSSALAIAPPFERADGIAVVPAERGAVEPGGAVEVQVLRGELDPWEG